jgi:choline dehydrogenase
MELFTVKDNRLQTPPIPTHCDTIVIGGGTAGAAIAGRLAARRDQSVLLLEAGPDYGNRADGQWPADLLDGRVLSDSHDWGYTSAARAGLPDHRLQRARVIGGCSSHNGCIALWGSRADYDGWAAAGNPGWSADELLPFFEKAVAALRVRDFAPAEVTPFHTACLQAMVAAGIPPATVLNDLDEDVGCGTAPVNIHDAVRWNTALAYLDPVRDEGHLTILGDTLVEKINVTRSSAVSVNILRNGGAATVATGRVIVCGGAYGSPAVMLRSGIGPAEDLRHLSIPTVLDLPGVGRNLHDHPAIELEYGGSERLSARMDEFIAEGRTVFTEQSLGKARSANCRHAIDLHVYPCSAARPDQDGRWTCILPVANMVPKSRGRLTLPSRDPAAKPVIYTGYLSDPDDADLAVLTDGVELTRRMARQKALAELIGDERPESAARVGRKKIRQACCHYYHPVGTCKMGPADDPWAVVDGRGRVHGTENITIADASIIPTIPRANTNLPVLALAERIASGLA